MKPSSSRISSERSKTMAIPQIGAVGSPLLGNSTFAVDVRNALPGSTAVLDLAFFPSNTAVGGCRVFLGLPLISMAPVPVGATGRAVTPLPIPTDPALAGLQLFGQYAVADPQGQLFGLASLSDGLRMVLGN